MELVYREASKAPLAVDAREVKGLAEMVLAEEGIDRPCELSLSVVDDAEMAELNSELRGVDAPTDVLSIELERPDEDPQATHPCMLGDLVLDPAFIARQAKDFETTPADETRLLVIHGMLHLLGYDHGDPGDSARMGAVQQRLVERATEGRVEPFTLDAHTGEPRP